MTSCCRLTAYLLKLGYDSCRRNCVVPFMNLILKLIVYISLLLFSSCIELNIAERHSFLISHLPLFGIFSFKIMPVLVFSLDFFLSF